MPLDLRPTKFATVNGRRVVTENNPYMLLSFNHEHVYIQKGQVYASGGSRLNSLPDWFETEIAKQGKEGLDAVGWTEHRRVGRPPKDASPEKVSGSPDEPVNEPVKEKGTLHLKKD